MTSVAVAPTPMTRTVSTAGATAKAQGRRAGCGRSAIRARTRAARCGVSGARRCAPISRSVASSSASLTGRLAMQHVPQPSHRARKTRLHRAARNVERLGHLGLREIEEVPVGDDEPVLLAQTAERPEYRAASLRGEGGVLGRGGTIVERP